MQNDHDEQHKRQLIERYTQGKATEKELMAFFGLINRQELDDLLLSYMDSDFEAARLEAHGKIHSKKQGRWWIGAAVAAVVICVGGYLYIDKKPIQQTAQNQNEIVPGSNKAILLSHGKKYSITDAKNGLIATQGNTFIRKTADGKLAYSGQSNESVVYDTLIVPRGGQHLLNLADGTIAYLNADTKIRYPESFSGKVRDMELISGEVFMHVNHNAAIAFNLKAKGQLIHDIGTEFDVTAYNDEAGVKTTLIQGVVKVTSASDKTGKILKPGQQAVNQNNSVITVQDADVDEVTAWKNGKFLFNDKTLADIMRQASRWYDVDVVYESENLKSKRFGAVTERFDNISQLLNTLEMTGKVKFTIQGRKIIVQSK